MLVGYRYKTTLNWQLVIDTCEVKMAVPSMNDYLILFTLSGSNSSICLSNYLPAWICSYDTEYSVGKSQKLPKEECMNLLRHKQQF